MQLSALVLPPGLQKGPTESESETHSPNVLCPQCVSSLTSSWALVSGVSGLDSIFPSIESHLIITFLMESFTSVGGGQMTLGGADMRIRLCLRDLIMCRRLTRPISPPWLPSSLPSLTPRANPPTAGAWSLREKGGG